jgi:hypothetical protein
MSSPTRAETHIDKPLTQLAIQVRQDAGNFVSDEVFPLVKVAKQSDKYFIWTPEDLLRDSMQKRVAGAKSEGRGFTLSNDSYYCDVYAEHVPLTYDQLDQADDPLDLRKQALVQLMSARMIRKEVDWASSFFAASIWGSSVTPTNQWSDFAASDPHSDIETGKATILENTGLLPNIAVTSYAVFQKLKRHPDILDQLKYTSAESVTPEMLARLFGLDKIYVGKAIKASGADGKTATKAAIFGKHFLLLHRNSAVSGVNPAPTAGVSFVQSGGNKAFNAEGAVVRRFDNAEEQVEKVELEVNFDHKVTASALGYMLLSVVA